MLYMSEVEPEITNTIEADEPVNELPPIEEEAPKAEPTIEAPTEAKPIEPLKNNSKTQARNEKKITCPKCAKTLTLKSYRYSHERNCQGPLESKPIKSIKPKAVPIAKPQKVEYREEEEQYVPPQQPVTNNIIAHTPPPRRLQPQPPANPLQNIAQHYQLLQNEYLRQKQEKYNALNKGIFGSRGKKR